MPLSNIENIIKGIEKESSPLISLSNRLIEQYCRDLDSSIGALQKMIDTIGETSIEDIPNCELEYFCVKIPAIMYYAGQKIEELGMQMDLATNQKKAALNKALFEVKGTVVEKRAKAESMTEDSLLVEAVYKRAYNTLKTKLDMAEKVYSALKKSLTKRIAEIDLDRQGKDAYLGEVYRYRERQVG